MTELAANMDGRIKACDEQIGGLRSAMADSGSLAEVVKLFAEHAEIVNATILKEAFSRIESKIQTIMGA